MTYLVVVGFSLWMGSESGEVGTRELLISTLVGIWSVRLSGFLFLRIHHKGKDGRFDDLENIPGEVPRSVDSAGPLDLPDC